MRQILPEIIIFSVESSANDNFTNEINTAKVQELLASLGVSYKMAEGCYVYENGQMESEKAFIVNAKVEPLVRRLCYQYEQECYLLSNQDRETILVYPDGSVTNIGKLQPYHAKPSGPCTYVDGQYWVAK